jgi:hypothetical protein
MAEANETQEWHKSSYSQTGGCVEFTTAADAVLLRDSKDPSGPRLRFSTTHWMTFLGTVRQGSVPVDGPRGRG